MLHEFNKTIIECKQCDFKCVRTTTLRRHELLHSKTTKNCPECKYVTYNPRLLLMHVKNKHRSEPIKQDPPKKVFQCPKCPYKTLMLGRINTHLESHSGDVFTPEEVATLPYLEPAVHKCDQCDYSSNRKEHMVRHKKNVHTEHRPYLCDTCGAAFKRTDALTAHKLVHIDKSLRNYRHKCKLCQKSFYSKVNRSKI